MAGVYRLREATVGENFSRLPAPCVTMVLPAVLIAVLLLLGVRAPAPRTTRCYGHGKHRRRIVYIDAAGQDSW